MKYAVETLEIELNRLVSVNRVLEAKVLHDENAATYIQNNSDKILEIKFAVNRLLNQDKERKKTSIDEVVDIVCEQLDVSRYDLFGKSRAGYIPRARQYVSYCCVNYGSVRKQTLARIFNCDHSTIIHHIKAIDDLLTNDRETISMVDFLKRECEKIFK